MVMMLVLKKKKSLLPKNFIKDGISIEVVSKNIGLSIEELEKIKKEM